MTKASRTVQHSEAPIHANRAAQYQTSNALVGKTRALEQFEEHRSMIANTLMPERAMEIKRGDRCPSTLRADYGLLLGQDGQA
jgi:hypothetical protein